MRPTFAAMAGGNHKQVLHMDPAYVKYANMNVNRHKYFRWTPKTAWLSFVYIVAVPSATLYLFYKHEGKYEMRGKLRGDVIAEF